ncbi:MAG: hypothetical protein HQL76_12210 [Magnetococcales bacterium]|nr:hypothetical protein [Magnetococcales bacterium]
MSSKCFRKDDIDQIIVMVNLSGSSTMPLSERLFDYLNNIIATARPLDTRKGSHIGDLIRANLLDGLEQNLFGIPFAECLITCWMREFGRKRKETDLARAHSSSTGVQPLWKPSCMHELLADSFDTLCDMRPVNCLDATTRTRGFRIHCQRPLGPPVANETYTNVTDAADFVSCRMDPEEKNRLAGELWIPVALNKVDILWANRSIPGPVTVKLNAHRIGTHEPTIGNPARVLWITPESGTLGHRKDATAARQLRDKLGLVHHFDKPLIAMSLPATTVQRLDHGRPTLADAGSQRRHMARGKRHAAPNDDPWGVTADLSMVNPNPSHGFDGLPERVVQPIPVKELPSVTIQYLGFCGPQQGMTPHQDDDQVFMDRLYQKHGGIECAVDKLRKILT